MRIRKEQDIRYKENAPIPKISLLDMAKNPEKENIHGVGLRTLFKKITGKTQLLQDSVKLYGSRRHLDTDTKKGCSVRRNIKIQTIQEMHHPEITNEMDA